jgi:uncharacterized protein (DUF427 family)
MIHNPEGRIVLTRHSSRVLVHLDNSVVADTDQSVQLSEKGYPDRQYLPRSAITAGSLQTSDTQTNCPFKGNATYYDFVLGDRIIKDAVWSYEKPYAAMDAIAGRMVFDPMQFDETVELDE